MLCVQFDGKDNNVMTHLTPDGQQKSTSMPLEVLTSKKALTGKNEHLR